MISGSYRSFLQGILRKIAIFYDVTPTAAVVEEEKFEWTSSERKSNSRGARGSVTPLASILRCFRALNYVIDLTSWQTFLSLWSVVKKERPRRRRRQPLMLSRLQRVTRAATLRSTYVIDLASRRIPQLTILSLSHSCT